MIRKSHLMLLIVISTLWGCDRKEKLRLQAKVDSLQKVADKNQLLSHTLENIGIMLDSIDIDGKILKNEIDARQSFSDYTKRLRNVNLHIAETHQKIEALERSLSGSNATNKGYLITIRRLKGELAASTIRANTLQKEVETIRNENLALIERNNQQLKELTEKAETIQKKENDFAALEAKANEITALAKSNQADLYFAQAQALETAAQRTRFAPKKKRETQREALELYKVALSLGKAEAQAKINELQKVIG